MRNVALFSSLDSPVATHRPATHTGRDEAQPLTTFNVPCQSMKANATDVGSARFVPALCVGPMDHQVDIIEAEAVVKAAHRAMSSLQKQYADSKNGQEAKHEDVPPSLLAARIAFLAAAEAAELAAEANLFSQMEMLSAQSPDALLSNYYA